MPHTRPTTDIAKEGLFNIIQNQLDIEGLRTLDLFGGTGKLSGVVLGVIILTMLSNILDLTGVNPFWNFIAVGMALWLSVSFRSRLIAWKR